MQLYAIAALAILAITMGQMPQTHAGPVDPVENVAGNVTNSAKIVLGDEKLSAGSNVLTIRDSLHNIVGHLKGIVVSTVLQIIPKPGQTFKYEDIEDDDAADGDTNDAKKHDSVYIPQVSDPSGDAIDELADQLGGSISFEINSLGPVVNGNQSVVSANGTAIDQLTQSSIQQRVLDVIVIGNSTLALPRAVVGLAISLEDLNNHLNGPAAYDELNSDSDEIEDNSLPMIKLGTPVVLVTDNFANNLAYLAGGRIINALVELLKLHGSNIHLVLDSADNGTVNLLNADKNVWTNISGNVGLTELVNQLGGQINLEKMNVTYTGNDGYAVVTSDFNSDVEENIYGDTRAFIDGKQSVVFGSEQIVVWLVDALVDAAIINVNGSAPAAKTE